jgi:Coenzyme PQQ synthesis protein D (PqqD)
LIHAPNIVHETVDRETIVIHLETGNYYSLTGSGAEIWALLEGADSVAALCAELAQRHARPEDEIRGPVRSFVALLRREGLVADGDARALAGPTPQQRGAVGGAWEPPKLERYDDMRDFLLVDPIHEVDRTGWPRRKVSETGAS